MATTRIRTLEFLPEIFRTEINSQFLSATLDVLTADPNTTKIEGYIGDTLGYGIDSRSNYVVEPSKIRNDYQLDPGVVFLRTDTDVAQDFLSYPGYLDALGLEGGATSDHSRLFSSQFYSWDSFVNLDTLNNFYQYYWLPNGPDVVNVSSSTVYVAENYVVSDQLSGYYLQADGQPSDVLNPTITLIRGGTYTFAVNQESPFWIQGEPGLSGFSLTQPNIPIRDILGVDRNGSTSGFLTFMVPTTDAQKEYSFPGNHEVDLISTMTFNQLNGAKLNMLPDGVDGVTSLDGRTVVFYNTGIPQEKGFVSSTSVLSSTPPADVNVPLVVPKTITIKQSLAETSALRCNSTKDLILGNAMTFDGNIFGGVLAYNPGEPSPPADPNLPVEQTIYYVNSIVSDTDFTLSLTPSSPVSYVVTSTEYSGNKINLSQPAALSVGERIRFIGATYANITEGIYYVRSVLGSTITVTASHGGPEFEVANWSGAEFGNMTLVTDTHIGTPPANITIWSYTTPTPMIGHVNGGLYEEGKYTDVNSTFYTIQYLIDPDHPNDSPTIRLVDIGTIPVNEKITAKYGTQWINRNFYRNDLNFIVLMPYFSSIKNELYYQDGITPGKVGMIKLIDSNTSNPIYVETDILGKPGYISPNKVTFTNGLKVIFSGDIIPSSYLNTEYYVEGVGTSIELIPVSDLISPELFTSGDNTPFDSDGNPYDSSHYDTTLYVPKDTDYLTISRNARNKNAWSRSNRWFHIDLISAVATYNNDPTVLTRLATFDHKAKRPILEYYPDLKLFNSGMVGMKPVDFLDTRTTDALNLVAGQVRYCPDVETYTKYSATISSATGATSTTITIPTADITGVVSVGHYVEDSTLALPANSYVETVVAVSGVTTITISWKDPMDVPAESGASLVFGAFTLDNFELFPGARIIFAGDTTSGITSKIFVANFSRLDLTSPPVITLTEATDSSVLDGNQLLVLRGYANATKTFYLDTTWKQAQQKSLVNQPPMFDVFDSSGISLGNAEFYPGTSFHGTKLFGYGIGSGSIDPVLGVPLKYSSVDNVGDISFEVFLNSDTFTWVDGVKTKSEAINTGYVYSYSSTMDYTRHIGWQKAVDKSVQYQVFEFQYSAATQTNIFVCDVAMQSTSKWSPIKVYVNNTIQDQSAYTVVVSDTTTTVNVTMSDPSTDTIVQILLLSPQVSTMAYYGLPINLTNNPFNSNPVTINMGDFRRHYDSIFTNAPGTTGKAFGPNNTRDLGNLVPYGDSMIQNSASLVLPGAFMRKQNFNLFDALAFSSREYVNFKALLINTANNIEYSVYQTPAYMLDAAMDQITAVKTEDKAFFWSDMLPAKAPYITNTYTMANAIDTTIYPLSKVYDYSKANYSGVLVYMTRKESHLTQTIQLMRGVDYVIGDIEAKLTLTKPLVAGDVIEVREFNQTYGSFVPNTPTKLGMYPVTQPKVIKDAHYMKPTWFIVGHDGSYTKLYGKYDESTGRLVDFRDQVLLEFEKRVFNNIKTDAQLPIKETEVVPGFFRDTGFDDETFNQVYQLAFLTWTGLNKVPYKPQVFSTLDEFTYNYSGCTNKVDNSTIHQGYWRGVYQYFYDTSTPDVTPWEMLHFRDKPTWWDTRYGPAPYTADNKVLWDDLAQGISWNNGSPVVIADATRPGLSTIVPVDSAGVLLSPYRALTKNYSSAGWQRDWKAGDIGPTEFSYRRSSSWPFDLMRIMALLKPAEFYNLGVDLDHYRYSEEFDQYLVDNRRHLRISDIEVYGSGTAKTSYLNWIVDYQKQFGVDATTTLNTMLDNLDVRLVYRMAGFSDKNLLKFYVEKSTINSRNSSLLIPDDSYSVILYDNQPADRVTYSGVIVQLMESGGYSVTGHSQVKPYFNTCPQKQNKFYQQVKVEDVVVKMYDEFYDTVVTVPYGTVFYSLQEVSQFLVNYGHYLETRGMQFETIDNGVKVDWALMVKEFLYWAQTGWSVGSLIILNPAAKLLTIDGGDTIVQPLSLSQQNFILNQNQYVIQLGDLAINRNGTSFTAQPMKDGDALSYGVFNVSSLEHGVVFNNHTIFNDVLYNLTTGLRQGRIIVKGTKSAEWNGTLDAQGFIMNQDNIPAWNANTIYVAGSIVLHRNKYWTTMVRLQATPIFDTTKWMETPYDHIQKGLLPNPSTRAHESTLYYNTNQANLENDGDLLGFSLIGYRPREYLSSADLSDVTQVNVYKSMIKNKGTLAAANMFKEANLKQGTIDYDIYENWAIKAGEFGGVMSSNFVEIKLNQDILNQNPSTVELTKSDVTTGVTQSVPLYALYNFGKTISTPYILPLLTDQTNQVYKLPEAGYVNFNDVKLTSYLYSGLPNAVDQNGQPVGVDQLNIGDYVWIANHDNTWQILTPYSLGSIVQATNNLTGLFTITFGAPHGLVADQLFAILNFDPKINGYYSVKTVLDPLKVTVMLSIAPGSSNNVITGLGVGFKFVSSRVATPADIAAWPQLPYEFSKNKVWVDSNVDDSWAVLQKNTNYQYQTEFTRATSSAFGSAVAYSDTAGFVIGDSGTGHVYRYKYNLFINQYELMSDPSYSGGSFGTAIAHADDVFVISRPTVELNVYKMIITDVIDQLVFQYAITKPLTVGSWGDAIALSGDTKWLYISDVPNHAVHVWRLSDVTNEYEPSSIIDGSTFGAGTGSLFGSTLSTDYHGRVLVVGAPNAPSDDTTIQDCGKAIVFHRVEQTIEVQTASTNPQYPLAWTSSITYAPVTSIVSNKLVCPGGDFTNVAIGDPVIFTSGIPLLNGISPNTVYYVESFPITVDPSFTIKDKNGHSVIIINNASCSMTYSIQTEPLYVKVNGQERPNSDYAIVDGNLLILQPVAFNTGIIVNAGDLIEVSTPQFVYAGALSTGEAPHQGTHIGTSVAVNSQGCEILVGVPFEQSRPDRNDINQEGAVFRFTNGGNRYGMLIGEAPCSLPSPITVLLNGFLVSLPAGYANTVAQAINAQSIPNIQASAVAGKLIIQLIDKSIAMINRKLSLITHTPTDASSLGFSTYTRTQIIRDMHEGARTQFGSNIKFNEFGSFVVSAPVATRRSAMTFGNTVFDNASTKFVDSFVDAGAVYMYDYVPTSNENINNPGYYLYAQSVNDISTDYGVQPMFGHAFDFVSDRVIIGTPNFVAPNKNGQVIWYLNSTGQQDWSVLRGSSPVIDVNGIKNTMLFDAKTNATQANLDYFDPLQGKLLGAVRENIDFISNQDPAGYNFGSTNPGAMTWTSEKVGKTWFDTSNVRFINYHQNDIIYNGKHWGGVFPGSDVAVYSWVASGTLPKDYVGPGKPYSTTMYSTGWTLTPSGNLLATYYFWVRHTNTISRSIGKTLPDTILEQYISAPQSSGISYFAALDQNIFALYNCQYTQDTVLHLGFSTGKSPDDTQSSLFNLIRDGYRDDFLPGLPTPGSGDAPGSLYGKLLDSLCGVTSSGMVTNLDSTTVEQLVPNPVLPKAVQYGINTRPSQSFFIDNLTALENYLEYANSVLIQYPISESKRSVFLYKKGRVNPSTGIPFFDTTDYWSYVNWWADGYTNNTRVAVQVDKYADLSELSVVSGTVAKVKFNGDGNWEVYVLQDTTWNRIGLQNGTIQFNNSLWDYSTNKLGFGESFFDTDVFSLFPSEETRNILRALNEEIYTNELLVHRNKSLMLIFEYIQSETLASQNYLSWMNKTSLVDVSHTVRPLGAVPVYQNDNQTFLSGFINEVKPYHVVIKEFLFKYTSNNVYPGTLTDFDLPSKWDSSANKFVTPALEYQRFSVDFTGSAIDISTNTITITPYMLSSGDLVKYVPADPTKNLDILINGYFYYVGVITEIPTYTIALYFSVTDMENNRDRVKLTPAIAGSLIAYDKTVGNTLPTDPIWQSPEYSEWISNYGVSITGVPEYPIAVLESFIEYNTDAFMVSSASGFPVTGIVLIDGEYIGYTSIQREQNILSGIHRGMNGSARTDHIPGTTIIMDLPAVLVLDGGRGYTEPPIVTAWIDTTKYPEPRRKAILRADIGRGSILRIVVEDPGSGYAVLPEIVIDPAFTPSAFASDQVNLVTNSFTLHDATIANGDLVKYLAGATVPTGLVPNRYYYIGVLETEPLTSVAMYYTIGDMENDRNRVVISSLGSGSFSVCGRASCVSSASPVRQNNMTLRFDRTAYATRMTDWTAGSFYGSFFAGALVDSDKVSSSSIRLQNTHPDISTIRASASGGEFEIDKIMPSEVIEWSSVLRNLIETESTFSTLQVMPLGYELLTIDELNNITPTLGFTPGMPVKFTGPFVSSTIVANTTYYVDVVISNTRFTIKDALGAPVAMDNWIVGTAPCFCYTGTVRSDLTLQLAYSGIRLTSGTNSQNNTVTIPLTLTGHGGTADLFTGSPITFTRTRAGGILQPMLANVIADQQYYVTSVFDRQTFSMSVNPAPQMLQVTQTVAPGVIVCNSTTGLAINNPVKFSNMVVGGISTSNFGGLDTTKVYYVSSINPNGTEFSVTSANNVAVTLTNVTGTCVMVNQRDTIKLTDYTGQANMNVGLPISPGQINGQQFTMYPTSPQYPVSTMAISNPLIRDLIQAVSSGVLVLKTSTGGVTNIYPRMPFTLAATYGGLASSTTYYVDTVGTLTAKIVSCDAQYFTCDGGLGTIGFYPGMPIVFSNMTIGAVDLGVTYYVHEVHSSSTFSIRQNLLDAIYLPLYPHPTADAGMMLTGADYITVTDTPGGAALPITDDTTATTLAQIITALPTFVISYILGGYRFAATNAGSGFSTGNVIRILGSNIGGVNITNDLSMVVDEVGTNGEIVSAILDGTPAKVERKYYFSVISEREVSVFYDANLTLPVSLGDFNFKGINSSRVLTTATTGVTVADTSGFGIDEPVYFTGGVFGGLELGVPYYVTAIPTPGTLTLSTTLQGVPVSLTPTAAPTIPCYAGAEGDYAYLPQPFYFTRSLVRLNHQVYQCVVSNNDDTFVIGKWQLLRPEDRRLNALDRIYAYYQPTVNMPGLDMTQLVSGIAYPNNIYRGNAFAPEYQYTVDTILQDADFHPLNINTASIIWNGIGYVAAGDTPTYSGAVVSATTGSWVVTELLPAVLGVTDMIFTGSMYVITSTNTFNPVIISPDGTTWVSNGEFTPYGSLPYEELPYDVSSINAVGVSLNGVAHYGDLYTAVGTKLITSHDAYSWTDQNAIPTNGVLNGVFTITTGSSHGGFVAIGKVASGTLLLTSFNSNGLHWTPPMPVPTITWTGDYSHALIAGAHNKNTVVILGENGSRMIGIFADANEPFSPIPYYTDPDNSGIKLKWSIVSDGFTTVTATATGTNYITVGDTSGLEPGSMVKFENALSPFGGITVDTPSLVTTYYVREVINPTTLTISTTVGGAELPLSNWTGNAKITNHTSVNDVLFAQNIGITKILSTSLADQSATVDTTANLEVGDPIVIVSGAFGGLVDNRTYYVKAVLSSPPRITLQEATVTVDFPEITTMVSATKISTNLITGDTTGFTSGRAIQFSGTSFGGIPTSWTFYVKTVHSPESFTISATQGGPEFQLATATGTLLATLSAVTHTTLTDVVLSDAASSITIPSPLITKAIFVAVGNRGVIQTSFDGITWKNRTTGTMENISGVTYAIRSIAPVHQDQDVVPTNNTLLPIDINTYDMSTFDTNQSVLELVAVADNNQVLKSSNGIDWTISSIFVQPDITYEVKGDDFITGYGPEEMVPGIIEDTLAITVKTRPGPTWQFYEHNSFGFNVVSSEFSSGGTFSFATTVNVPAQVALFLINGTTGLSTTLHTGYTVDWVNKVVTLDTPLSGADRIRLDVYKVGGGNQLVKSNTDNNPVRVNEITGFNEIYLECSYSGEIYLGSGAVVSNSEQKSTMAIRTIFGDNTIECLSVANFSINQSIMFQGTPFGGILNMVEYFVKSINTSSNTITVSESFVSGVPGPAAILTAGIGNMEVLINTNRADTWTPPCVMHNGTKLVKGYINTVSETHAPNILVLESTVGILAGNRVTFGSTAFGSLSPFTTYYVTAILDSTTLTIETAIHTPVALGDAYGGVSVITNDYAIDIVENSDLAKIVLSGTFTRGDDYISYSIFGETIPQLGYSLPETESLIANGVQTTFNLSNYIGGDNWMSAVAELNGIRLSDSAYTINPLTNSITLTTPPSPFDVVSVTSFNLTDAQYLHTQHATNKRVSNIINVDNSIALPIAETRVTYIDGESLTCADTTGFILDRTISFYGVGLSASGGITFGAIYYVQDIVDGVTFKISQTPGGTALTLAAATTVDIICKVNDRPALRITTGVDHGFADNNIVRIDGVSGSHQLNNNTYHVRVIDAVRFDLYESTWNASLAATNFPVTAISSYVSGGFTWIDGTFILTCATVSAVTGVDNMLHCDDTMMLVPNTPVIFTGTPFGGILENTWYYILKVVDSIRFTISETLMGPEFDIATDATGSMIATQWDQLAVDRLWVTIDGHRVPSSSLRLNSHNNLSILSLVLPADEVTITNMIPTPAPNELTYLNLVSKNGTGTVYNANGSTRTWLSAPLGSADTTIHVQSASKLIHTIVQPVTAGPSVNGVRTIGLTADKRLICKVTVYNNTTSTAIDPNRLVVTIVSNAPALKILGDSGITTGDSLTITTIEGDLLYINGEQIRFTSVDLAMNTISGLQRGTNGTGIADHPIYAEVFGIQPQNRMNDAQYHESWQDADFPDFDGDTSGVPLQLGESAGALFLNQDIILE